MLPAILDPIARRTLPDLLATRAASRPSKTFLTFVDREMKTRAKYTYAEVDAHASRVAAYLQKTGIKKGETVVLHMPNVPEFLFAWLGIAKAGAIMVATNLKSAPDEMEYFLTHSEAKCLISHAEHLEAVEPILEKCPAIREVILAGENTGKRTPFSKLLEGDPADFKAPAIDPLDTCAILYTSGTTSRPKGVMITHGNYVWASEVMCRTTALREEDRHIVCAPFFHINAQTYSTLPALAAGADMVLMERFSKRRYWDVCAEHKPTVASLVTSMIRMLLSEPFHPQEKSHNLRLVGCGAKTPDFEKRYGVKTIGWFGMTETLTVPLATSLQDAGKAGAIGFVNPGYRARVLREDGSPCGPGEVGALEIWGVPGVSLMKGYLKNEEATRETISPDGWLKTGDNVSVDERGYVTYVNRGKDMLKVGGENVAASEIERVVQSHPAVYEAAAIAIPDAMLGEVPKVFALFREGKTATPEEIIAWCKERLASFKVPRAVEFRQELPRSTLDKVAKKVLLAEEAEKRQK